MSNEADPRDTAVSGRPSTADELRRAIVAGIDSVLEAPWILRRFTTDDSRRLLRAQRRYWVEGGEGRLAELLALLDQEP